MKNATPYSSSGEATADLIRFFRASLALVDTQETSQTPSPAALSQEYILLCARENLTQPPLPAAVLRELLNLDEYGAFCLRAAFSFEADGVLRNRSLTLLGTPCPSYDFLFGLYERMRPGARPEHLLLLSAPARSPLRFLFQPETAETRGPWLLAPLRLRENVLRFLCGQRPEGGRYYRLFYDEPCAFLPLHHTAFEALSRTVNTPGICAFLTGVHGSGKRTLARRVAAAAGLACLLIGCGALCGLTQSALYALSVELALDAALANAVVCIYDYTPEYKALLTVLCGGLFPATPLILLGEDSKCTPPDPGRCVLPCSIGTLAPEDYDACQAAFSGDMNTEQPQYGARRDLTVGQLWAVWSFLHSKNTAASGADFAAAATAAAGPVSLARVVPCKAGLESLLLDAQTTERLDLLIRLLQSRRAEMRGVTALFYGPSGTGKTAAAAALAHELKLELLKIDLSRIMDKYIGETEKHLQELFTQAKKRGCILFFDEADALFSKRTEISSSHDRYANVETSFLLQSIEEYDGAVVLATNLYKNFDDAFLRRIDLLVRFSMPDTATRRKLWQSVLPAEPDGVTLEALAELELSPAEISLAARNAVCLCTPEAPRISADLLRQLISSELEKRGKRFSDLDLLL